ncbi:MAG TPA: hypothetical protein VIJ23_11970, partial [Mycobacterium sp.]
MRPVDGGAQRLLAAYRRAGAAGQQPEAVVQAVQNFGWRQSPGACGCQFDRERDAVEAAADLGDCACVVVGHREIGADMASAVREQLDRFTGW